MQIYVNAKSKRDLNRRIKDGEPITGLKYEIFSMDIIPIHRWDHNSSIKVYEKCIDGNPYAKSYGVYDKNKNMVK